MQTEFAVLPAPVVIPPSHANELTGPLSNYAIDHGVRCSASPNT
jgi:hypothetical protein